MMNTSITLCLCVLAAICCHRDSFFASTIGVSDNELAAKTEAAKISDSAIAIKHSSVLGGEDPVKPVSIKLLPTADKSVAVRGSVVSNFAFRSGDSYCIVGYDLFPGYWGSEQLQRVDFSIVNDIWPSRPAAAFGDIAIQKVNGLGETIWTYGIPRRRKTGVSVENIAFPVTLIGQQWAGQSSLNIVVADRIGPDPSMSLLTINEKDGELEGSKILGAPDCIVKNADLTDCYTRQLKSLIRANVSGACFPICSIRIAGMLGWFDLYGNGDDKSLSFVVQVIPDSSEVAIQAVKFVEKLTFVSPRACTLIAGADLIDILGIELPWSDFDFVFQLSESGYLESVHQTPNESDP